MATPTYEADGPYPVPSYEELMRSSGGWPVMPPVPDGTLGSSGGWAGAQMTPEQIMRSSGGWPVAPPMPPGQMPAGAWPPGSVPVMAPAYPPPGYPPQPAPQPQPKEINYISPATAALLRRLPAPGPRNSRQTVEHRDVTGGSLRAAVFGAMDGVVTNASLIAGATGAHSTNHTIILTGLAGLVAGAFSMATGEYISVTSQNEVTNAEVESERVELEENPGRELAELAEIYMDKGLEPTLALEVARQLSENPKQALTVHAREELGIDPDDLPSPWTAATASFAAFTGGALTPLMPYLLGVSNFALSLALAGAFALGGGALVARAANRPGLSGGMRQLALGALATGMTFLVGQLVGAQVG
jgi:VIT1/CCC1 family predicted Fe2+/Mn2+ transporter